jgi:large subunit ribosomal protein L18Ae
MPKQVDPSLVMKIYQYVVYGRRLPTEKDPNPQVVCFRVFAKNENFAKSQFWYDFCNAGSLTRTSTSSRPARVKF